MALFPVSLAWARARWVLRRLWHNSVKIKVLISLLLWAKGNLCSPAAFGGEKVYSPDYPSLLHTRKFLLLWSFPFHLPPPPSSPGIPSCHIQLLFIYHAIRLNIWLSPHLSGQALPHFGLQERRECFEAQPGEQAGTACFTMEQPGGDALPSYGSSHSTSFSFLFSTSFKELIEVDSEVVFELAAYILQVGTHLLSLCASSCCIASFDLPNPK